MGPRGLRGTLRSKPWIVPIPDTTKLNRLDEKIGAVSVELTSDDLQEIDSAASKVDFNGPGIPKSWSEGLVCERTAVA